MDQASTIRPGLGRLVRLWLALVRPVLARRHAKRMLERMDGVPLLVLPEVFNPVLLRSGKFLAQTVTGLPLKDGESVLDLGCGTGVGAVFSARRGARVVAVDVNPEAVRCARINALLNHLEDRIDVRLGDLFAPVGDQRFDLILFNPPFFRGQPRTRLDLAWRSPDVLERFAAQLGGHLTGSGRAVLILSTAGEWKAALDALKQNGFAARPFSRQDLISEVFTAYLVEPPADH